MTSEIVTTMKTAKTHSRTTTITDATRATNVAPIMLTRVIATITSDANTIVPAAPGVVADEQRRRVAPEGDGEHPGHDHEGGGVSEPGRDAEQPSVPEALQQVLDQPALGRIPDPELDDVVREQHRDEPGEEEREPDGGPGDDRGLAEEREDAGPDHRADADERGAADGHARSGIASTTDRIIARKTLHIMLLG